MKKFLFIFFLIILLFSFSTIYSQIHVKIIVHIVGGCVTQQKVDDKN